MPKPLSGHEIFSPVTAPATKHRIILSLRCASHRSQISGCFGGGSGWETPNRNAARSNAASRYPMGNYFSDWRRTSAAEISIAIHGAHFGSLLTRARTSPGPAYPVDTLVTNVSVCWIGTQRVVKATTTSRGNGWGKILRAVAVAPGSPGEALASLAVCAATGNKQERRRCGLSRLMRTEDTHDCRVSSFCAQSRAAMKHGLLIVRCGRQF
jgi:hypothetical protein